MASQSLTNEVPLDKPYYDCSFGEAISRFFRKYWVFEGRASRSEFWWSILFIYIGYFVIAGFTYLPGTDSGVGRVFSFIWVIFFFATLLPYLSLSARRLHDIDMSAWWLLLYLTGIGTIMVLTVGLVPSNPTGVRFDLDASDEGDSLVDSAEVIVDEEIPVISETTTEKSRERAPGFSRGEDVNTTSAREAVVDTTNAVRASSAPLPTSSAVDAPEPSK